MWFTRHKFLALAIIIGSLGMVLVFVAVIPLFQNASMIMSKVKSRSTDLDSLITKVSILSKLDPSVLNERMSVIDNALPPRKDILLYLTSIDGLSRELGLTFGGLSLAPGDITAASGSAEKSKRISGLQSLETEIKMQGGQDNIYAFLKTIENVLPLMQIKDIKVTVLDNDKYSLALTLAMLWAEPTVLDVKGPISLFGAEEDKYFAQLSGYRRYDSIVNATVDQEKNQRLFSSASLEVGATPSQVQSAVSGSEDLIPQQ